MFTRWLEKPRRSALLLGPRRAGKSTYLRNTFSDFKYITLDDLDTLDLAETDPKALLEGQQRIILDEIQRAPKLTIAAKYAIDEQGATVLMSGSSRIGLLDASADSLAGRIDIQELPPACWGEAEGDPTHSIFDDRVSLPDIRVAQRALEAFVQYGGFPEVVSAPTDAEKEAILTNYKNTYFTRDLSLLSNIEDVAALRAILQYYALSLGSITQVEHFRQEAHVSHMTAKKYLQSVYQSGLGFTLLGYHHGPAKRYIKGSKSYYCDTGIPTALQVQCSQGQIIENFVISEFEKRRKLGWYRTDQLYFFKSSSGFEIDLIIAERDIVRAVEIKATKNPTPRDVRHVQAFVDQAPDTRRGYLMYMGAEYRQLGDVLCLPIAAIFRGK